MKPHILKHHILEHPSEGVESQAMQGQCQGRPGVEELPSQWSEARAPAIVHGLYAQSPYWTEIILRKIAWLKLSGKFPTGLGIPFLETKMQLEKPCEIQNLSTSTEIGRTALLHGPAGDHSLSSTT